MATALQFVDDIASESPAADSVSVRLMARFFFATFWTIIFTGAVRKWVFPGVAVVYLLQDVPIALAYLYALWSGTFTRGYLTLGVIVFSSLVTMQALVQMIIPELNPFVATVGLHHYLFYIPMLLVFPICLTEAVRRRFIFWNLMLSLPMCMLALAQNALPKSSWINRSSEGEGFGVSGAEVARVMGTFNFALFYGIWVAMAVSLCFGEWLLPQERRTIRNRGLLIACTFAANLCHLVSASRLVIVLSGLALAGAIIAAVVLRSGRAIVAMGGICVLIPLAAAATFVISPDEFNVVRDRFTGQQYQTENQSRVADALIGFLTVPKISMLGAGIGMGVDAAHAGNADAYNFTYSLAEQDLIRNVMELGTPIGMIYALTRVGFAFGMIALAIGIVRRGSTPHVLPLSVYLIGQAYTGDMTRNATMTATQVMVGYAFILGAYYYPDKAASTQVADHSSMRSV